MLDRPAAGGAARRLSRRRSLREPCGRFLTVRSDGVGVVELAVKAQDAVALAFRTAGRRRWGGGTLAAFFGMELSRLR
jgi:hypothetical protein